MAQIALFSDIHGNYEGLTCVFREAENKGATQWMCLGDFVSIKIFDVLDRPPLSIEFASSKAELPSKSPSSLKQT